MNFLLEITKDQLNDKILQLYGPAETFLFGAKIVLIGLGAVFGALCLIWLALFFFKVFFHDLASKKSVRPEKVAAPVVVEETVDNATDDSEIIAVIAAAIAMAESEAPNTKFRVVSFRRT